MGSVTSYGFGQYQASESHQVWLPDNYPWGGVKRVAIWCHGAGGDYATGPVEKALVASGIPMIATDLGGARTWGSDTSLTRVTTAWTYAKTNFGAKTDKYLLWGGSMGGLTAILQAIADPTHVAAVGCAIPTLDPQWVHDNDPGTPLNHDAIETVYGGATVPAGKQAVNQGAAYAATGIPLKVWHSTTDTFTPSASTATFLAASGCQSVSLGAVGHSYLSLDTAQAVQFFAPYRA